VTDTSHGFGEKLLARAAQYLPELAHVDLEEVTLGWRVMPQDEYPILGFADACPNFYIAATHSGVTLAPVVGQFAAAEILDARVPQVNVALHDLIGRAGGGALSRFAL
jgi:glycine/D-amino acid oxidase-like deaminating enzyme